MPISFPQDPMNRSTAKSYIRLNTGMPPYPPVRKSDGGSGEFDSQLPNKDDYYFRNEMRLKGQGAWWLGYPNASRNLLHFLDASGTTLDVDVRQMMKDIELFRDDAAKSYQETVIGPINSFILDNYSGSSMEFSIVPKVWSSSESPGIKGSSDEDWFLAMGKFDFNYTSTVYVTPQSDGTVRVSINSNLHVYDRYDWNAGKSAQMPVGPKVFDDSMARLHRVGMGRDFEIRGSTPVKPVTYIYNPRPAAPRRGN